MKATNALQRGKVAAAAVIIHNGGVWVTFRTAAAAAVTKTSH